MTCGFPVQARDGGTQGLARAMARASRRTWLTRIVRPIVSIRNGSGADGHRLRRAYTRPMRIGFKTSQTNVDWPTLRETWELGDTLPVFDSAWIFDHFVALGDDGGCSHEGMVLAGA